MTSFAHMASNSPPGDALCPTPNNHGPEPPPVALRPATMHRSDSIAIAKLAQTGRSSTLAAPFGTKQERDPSIKRSHLSLHGHKHHSHHHHHHHRHASRSSKYGGDEKEIKSAVLPTVRPQFPEINVVKPANSSTSGGSGSANDLVSPSVVAEYDQGVRRVASRVVKPEDVSRERACQRQRDEYVSTTFLLILVSHAYAHLWSSTNPSLPPSLRHCLNLFISFLFLSSSPAQARLGQHR